MKPTPPPAGSSSLPPLQRVLARLDAAAAADARPLRLDGPRSSPAVPNDSVTTGFPSLDRLLGGGVRAGDLVVVGGDVGSGKSALALALALRAASADAGGDDADGGESVDGDVAGARGGDVVFLSGEMVVDRVVERALAIEGRARVDDLRRGAFGDEAGRGAVGAAALRLRDAALDIDTLPAGGVDALGDRLRRTLDLRMVVVDPIESLAVGARGRDEEIATAAGRLKSLALELGAPVVVTAQLPRLERADRADLRPRLDDFGALGALAEQADVVLGLFREEMYDAGAPGVEGATELIVLKNRNGPTGYVDLYFYKQWMRFEDMVES